MPRLVLPASTRRHEKVPLEQYLALVRDGGNITLRAVAQTAYRVHVLKLAQGEADEESIEAEAGAILDAELAHDLHVLVKSQQENEK